MNRLISKLINILKVPLRYIQELLEVTKIHLLDLLFKIFDFFLPLLPIGYFIKNRFPKLWDIIINITPIKNLISRNLFKNAGEAALPRPLAFSMAAKYPAWFSFVDTSYTSRHIPIPDKNDKPHEPKISDVVPLFMREDEDIKCIRSSYLFASFAQWFTDSFLRTSHALTYDPENGNVIVDTNGFPIRDGNRAQKNTSNHQIDLCQIYGLSEDKTKLLRGKNKEHDDRGCLEYEVINGEEYPPFLLSQAPEVKDGTEELSIKDEFLDLHDERLIRFIFRSAKNNTCGYETIFATGLEHSNSTISNSLMNVIFFRAHNNLARKINKKNQSWSDERVFQTARNVMIVLLLKIVISDYIRHISPLNPPFEFQPGYADKQPWYRTNRMSIEFNLLYRWHSLVPDNFSFLNSPYEFRHNNQWLIDTGVENAVEMLSRERASSITLGNTPKFLEGVEYDTISLMRQAQFASYNKYRKHFGLSPAKSFEDVTTNPTTLSKLKTLYKGDVNKLEWFVGLFAEDHGLDAIMGDLMVTMVGHDAFTQALTNPLLSKNLFNEDTFSPIGWEIIHNTSTLKEMMEQLVYPNKNILCSFQYEKAGS